MDQITKNKIAQCLALSMEIEGAFFYKNPNVSLISVYKIENNQQVWDYSAYYDEEFNNIDKMIKDLSNHINNETPSH